jgi:hypothetical protein
MLKVGNVMKMEENYIDKAIEAVRTCLDKVPFVKLGEIVRDPLLFEARPDLIVRVNTSSGEITLVVEIKASGQPRIVRNAIDQLQTMIAGSMRYYGVLAAPYIAEASADLCRRAGIGYIDFSGNCRLSFGQVYIEITGQPNKYAEKRDLRALYSPKASRVLRVLLNQPSKPWKLMELAREADVSLGQVANVKQMLLDREWLKIIPEGLYPFNPQDLLADWAENYSYLKNRVIEFYSLLSVNDLEYKIARACTELKINYAFSGFSAAARLAPMVRYQKASLYIPGDAAVRQLQEKLELREAPTGANLMLMIPYDEGVYYGAKNIADVKIVSPIQAYLDVKSYKGRGEEAAVEILRNVIMPTW